MLTATAESAEPSYEVPQAKQEPVAPASSAPSSAVTESTVQTTSNATAGANHEVQTKVQQNDAEEWDESLYDSYGKSLQKQCERNKQYPAIAVRRSLEGSGVVVVKFGTGGQLQSVAIEQSSGHKALDDQAIVMVKKSLSDLPLPAKLKGRDFKISVPFEFRLE